jgi:hypothetical protein
MTAIRLTAALTCLALAACTNTGRKTDAHDSLMANITAEQRRPIDDARAQHDRCTDALASARQEVVRAEAQADVAKQDLSLAEARVKKASAVVSVAETGSTSDLESARESLRTAEAAVAPQRELIHWRAAQVTRSECAATLAEREEALAAARVELAKARAFVDVDQAAARDIDVGANEACVSECQKQAALANVELEAAARDCDQAERAYESSRTKSEDLSSSARAARSIQ